MRRNKKYCALGRLKAGQMNKTEEQYAEELKMQLHMGEILWWCFEGLTFKLADNTRYTPDFIVLTKEMELQAREIKGSFKFVQDDAKVKIKCADEKFPIRFFMLAPKPKKLGGGWEVKEIGA